MNLWRLVNKLELEKEGKSIKIRVSTVQIIDYGAKQNYETMIFTENDSEVNLAGYFQERYDTQEEAKKNHYHILDMLQSGFFELKPTEYQIKIRGYD